MLFRYPKSNPQSKQVAPLPALISAESNLTPPLHVIGKQTYAFLAIIIIIILNNVK